MMTDRGRSRAKGGKKPRLFSPAPEDNSKPQAKKPSTPEDKSEPQAKKPSTFDRYVRRRKAPVKELVPAIPLAPDDQFSEVPTSADRNEREGTPSSDSSVTISHHSDEGATSNDYTLFYWAKQSRQKSKGHFLFGVGIKPEENRQTEYILAAITVLSEKREGRFNLENTKVVVTDVLKALSRFDENDSPFQQIQRLAHICKMTPNKTVDRIAILFDECCIRRISNENVRQEVCEELQTAIDQDVSKPVWNAATQRVFGCPKTLDVGVGPVSRGLVWIRKHDLQDRETKCVEAFKGYVTFGRNAYQHENGMVRRLGRASKDIRDFFTSTGKYFATSLATITSNGEVRQIEFAALRLWEENGIQQSCCLYKLPDDGSIQCERNINIIGELKMAFAVLFCNKNDIPTVLRPNNVNELFSTAGLMEMESIQKLNLIDDKMALAFFARFGQPWYAYDPSQISALGDNQQVTAIPCTVEQLLPLNYDLDVVAGIQQQNAFRELRRGERRNVFWTILNLETFTPDIGCIMIHVALSSLHTEGAIRNSQLAQLTAATVAQMPDAPDLLHALAVCAVPLLATLNGPSGNTYPLTTPDGYTLSALQCVGGLAFMRQMVVFGCTVSHSKQWRARLAFGQYDLSQRSIYIIICAALKTMMCVVYVGSQESRESAIRSFGNVAVQTPLGTCIYLLYFVLSQPGQWVNVLMHNPAYKQLMIYFFTTAVLRILCLFVSDTSKQYLFSLYNFATVLYVGWFSAVGPVALNYEVVTQIECSTEATTAVNALLTLSVANFISEAFSPPVLMAVLPGTLLDVLKMQVDKALTGKLDVAKNVADFDADVQLRTQLIQQYKGTDNHKILTTANGPFQNNTLTISNFTQHVYNCKQHQENRDKAMELWRSTTIDAFELPSNEVDDDEGEAHQAHLFQQLRNDIVSSINPLGTLYELQQQALNYSPFRKNVRLKAMNHASLYWQYGWNKATRKILQKYYTFLIHVPSQLRYAMQAVVEAGTTEEDFYDALMTEMNEETVVDGLRPSWLLTHSRPIVLQQYDNVESDYSSDTTLLTYLGDVYYVFKELYDAQTTVH